MIEMNEKHHIYVDLCLNLVNHGFSFIETIDNKTGSQSTDYDMVINGTCQECGTPIRYEQHFLDKKLDERRVLGRVCTYKLYVLSVWRQYIKEEDLENKHLQRAGKWLWILNRDYKDHLGDYEIPNPSNCETFEELANKLKTIVFTIRKSIKIKEKEEKNKQVKHERYVKRRVLIQKFIDDLCIDLDLCNDSDKSFLTTVFKYDRYGWNLTEKQQKWLDDIKNRCRIGNEIKDTITNDDSYDILNDIVKLINSSNWDSLNLWEKTFVGDMSKRINEGKTLTENMIKTLDKIRDKLSSYKVEYDEYVGKKINPWIINQKFGVWLSGGVVAIKKKTEKAILCDLVIIDGDSKTLHEEQWIPKRMILDEMIL